MNYEEALEYIDQLNHKGISLGLDRVRALLSLLGEPHNDLRCIHVAGTNGKGSVCAMMDSALQQAGLRIGRYSSPTLYDYRERIQVNGHFIEKEAVAALLTEIQQACLQMEQQGMECPTVFEVETALAFLYFRRQQCDYVLLEVGMGGRLDSTNVIAQPVLSVITTISLDHTRMLGTTLVAIAAEKAGIIKEGCPVVMGIQQPEAMQVLLEQCRCCHTEPVLVDGSSLRNEGWSQQGQSFSYGRWQKIEIGLLGDYQQMNGALALEALQVLQHREPILTDDCIRRGMAAAQWPGRFEIIGEKPLFIVDGAHNPDGAQALAKTLQQHFSENKIWLLMAVFADKDYRQIGQIMACCSACVYCFAPDHERALSSKSLAEAMAVYFDETVDAGTAEMAVQQVLERAGAEDVIVSFGSLSTIKAVQEAVGKLGVSE